MKKVIIEDDLFQIKAVKDDNDTYGTRWYLYANVNGVEKWHSTIDREPTSVELKLLLNRLLKEGRI